MTTNVVRMGRRRQRALAEAALSFTDAPHITRRGDAIVVTGRSNEHLELPRSKRLWAARKLAKFEERSGDLVVVWEGAEAQSKLLYRAIEEVLR